MPRYIKYPVKGYEGLYWITKQGRVYSKRGELSLPINKQGYVSITLSKNGVAKGWRVHRLMLLTFVPNPDNKPQCNHKNSIRHDNRLTNLEWCTPAENMAHASIAMRRRNDKLIKDALKIIEKNRKKFMKEHPKEYQEHINRYRGGFGSLLPRELSQGFQTLTPRQTELGRGFGSLIPSSFSDITDVSKKSVDNV